MPTVKKLFEISFVDHDDPFYQIDNLPVYKLYCRTFEYSSEVLDTGIYAIDDIETKRSTDALAYWEFSLENQVAFNERIGQEWGTIYDQNPSTRIHRGRRQHQILFLKLQQENTSLVKPKRQACQFLQKIQMLTIHSLLLMKIIDYQQ